MTPGSSLLTGAVVLLIAWRMYVRIKRLVGRQKSKIWRHWITVILFPTLAALLALGAASNPEAEGALAGGIAVGVGLAIFGLRKTRFETTPIAYYYTPNAHIGIALSLLLVARIGYRFYEMWAMSTAQSAGQMQDFGRSPLTLAIFGTLAAYYTAYAIGIIRWRWATPLPGSREKAAA